MTRLFDLPETKGYFQICGIVTGAQKNGFYKETQTKTGKPMRSVNFGVQYNNYCTIFTTIQGFIKDTLVFSKRQKNEKPLIMKVDWADRFNFNKEGFLPIGVKLGVKKVEDEEGKLVNDRKTLSEFDACKEIADNLQDNQSVYVKGKTEFSSFISDSGEIQRIVRLIPQQISLCKDINFTSEEYSPLHEFTQTIIFMGIYPEKDNAGNNTSRHIVSAKIVTYSNIEDTEYIIENNDLASVMRKNLKPYQAIKVGGEIKVSIKKTEVETENHWGEKTKMERIDSPVVREYIIVGADPSTIESEVYSEQAINEALKKIKAANTASKNFGDDLPWEDNAKDDMEDWV